MTTNDATARERTGVMEHGYYLDDRGQIACAIDKVGFDRGWDKEVMLEAADDVIAYLWSRADDDDVVDAVAVGIVDHPAPIPNARGHIHRLMTALLGPNPNEQEASDGQ